MFVVVYRQCTINCSIYFTIRELLVMRVLLAVMVLLVPR